MQFSRNFFSGILLSVDLQRFADSKKIAVFCLNDLRNAGEKMT